MRFLPAIYAECHIRYRQGPYYPTTSPEMFFTKINFFRPPWAKNENFRKSEIQKFRENGFSKIWLINLFFIFLILFLWCLEVSEWCWRRPKRILNGFLVPQNFKNRSEYEFIAQDKAETQSTDTADIPGLIESHDLRVSVESAIISRYYHNQLETR